MARNQQRVLLMRGSKSNQYPPQTGYYKVKPKHGENWQEFDHVRLQISVGQEYHEGDKLKACIEWALCRFDKITICLNDTLQASSIAFSERLSINDALKKSIKMGDDWLKRNGDILKDSKINVVRWDYWINHPDYADIYSELDYVYRINDEFCKGLEDNITSFWIRRSESMPDIYTKDRYPFFYKSSKKYLLEEGAAFILMNRLQKGLDVYPGSILKCFEIMQKDETHGDLFERNFLRIDFSKNKNKAA